MAQAEVGALRVRLAMNAGEFTRGAKKSNNAMASMAAQAKKLGAALGAAFAVQQVSSFFTKSVQLFGKQQQAIKGVEGVLKTTGNAAGFTSQQLQDMASKLQSISTFGDEDILKKVTNNMLTFGNIVGPVFERAQVAALNLSTTLNQDLQSSTIQLGKALNDPVKGITALSRVGIAFTNQQKKQIETLVRSNKVMEAQGVILDEIEKFYGEAAKAARDTDIGAWTAAMNDFGDAMEEVGKVLGPLVRELAAFISDMSTGFIALTPEMKKFSVTLVAVTAALGTVAVAVGVLVAVFGAMAAPIAVAVAAIGTITAALVAFWPNVKQVAGLVGGAFKDMFMSAKKWLVDAMKPIIDFLNKWVQKVVNAFNQLRGALGLDEVMAPVIEGMKMKFNEGVQVVTAGGEAIKQAWIVKGEEIAKETPNIVANYAKPSIELKKIVTQEEKDIIAAQKRLIDQGVSLSENLQTPYDIMKDKVMALSEAHKAGKISADAYGNAQFQAAMVAQNAYAGMASDITSSLEAVFGESKAFAIVSAIINTYEAFTKALATYPPPYSYVAAAASLAAGLAKVAAIKSTTKSTKSANTAGGSGGGAGATAGTPGTQGAGGGGAQQTLVVEGIDPGDIFNGATVSRFAQTLLDYQRDGGQVILAQ